MKEMYICEICNQGFNVKSSAEYCETKHLRRFLHELNRHAKIAKQLGFTFVKKYDSFKDEYMDVGEDGGIIWSIIL